MERTLENITFDTSASQHGADKPWNACVDMKLKDGTYHSFFVGEYSRQVDAMSAAWEYLSSLQKVPPEWREVFEAFK